MLSFAESFLADQSIFLFLLLSRSFLGLCFVPHRCTLPHSATFLSRPFPLVAHDVSSPSLSSRFTIPLSQ